MYPSILLNKNNNNTDGVASAEQGRMPLGNGRKVFSKGNGYPGGNMMGWGAWRTEVVGREDTSKYLYSCGSVESVGLSKHLLRNITLSEPLF